MSSTTSRQPSGWKKEPTTQLQRLFSTFGSFLRFFVSLIFGSTYLYVMILTLLSFPVLVLFFAYHDLPQLHDMNKCFVTTMYQVTVCPTSKDFVKLNQIPLALQGSVLLSEDASFWIHPGIDIGELQASVEKNIKTNTYARGGSTITQQLVKNIYLNSEKTMLRKIKELTLTIQTEKSLSKKQILELYFNIVEFAPDIYGIKKASQYYFLKLPSQLTVSESLFLGTLLPNPKVFSQSRVSRKLGPYHQKQMKIVAGRLFKVKRIDQFQYSIALQRIDLGFWDVDETTLTPQKIESVDDDAYQNDSELPTDSDADTDAGLTTDPDADEIPDKSKIESPNESADKTLDEPLENILPQKMPLKSSSRPVSEENPEKDENTEVEE